MTLDQIQALTDEEICVKVAELCGFIQDEPWNNGRPCWSHKDYPPHVGFEEVPNYPADLNAIQDAIVAHADSLPSKYERAEWLCMVEAYAIRSREEPSFIASARTRCEAFLAVMTP